MFSIGDILYGLKKQTWDVKEVGTSKRLGFLNFKPNARWLIVEITTSRFYLIYNLERDIEIRLPEEILVENFSIYPQPMF